jgi:hypothetical protein
MLTAAGIPEIWKSATIDKPATAGTASVAEPQVTAGTKAKTGTPARQHQ